MRCARCGSEVRESVALAMGALATGGFAAILAAALTNLEYPAIASLQMLPLLITSILGRLTSPAKVRRTQGRIAWYQSPIFWLAVLVIPVVALGFL